MTIFDQTETIVREAELVVSASANLPEGRFRKCLHFLMGAPWFLLMGFGVLIKPIVVAILLSIAFALILHFGDGAATSGRYSSTAVSIALGLTFTAFSLPSRSAIDGVKAAHILSIKNLLDNMAQSGDQIARLRAGVLLVQGRTQERISRMIWVLGIAWAGLAWLYTREAAKSGLLRIDDMQWTLLYAVALSAAAIAIASYAAATRVLFQTLEFSFIESNSRFNKF